MWRKVIKILQNDCKYLNPLDRSSLHDGSKRIPNSARLLKRTAHKPVRKSLCYFAQKRYLFIICNKHYNLRTLTCMRKYPVWRCKLKDTCSTENSPSRRKNVRFLYGEPIKSNCDNAIPGMKFTDKPSCHS